MPRKPKDPTIANFGEAKNPEEDDGKPHPTWEFTIFGDIEAETEWLRGLEWNVMVAYQETCETTQRLHIQGRVTFKRAYRFAALKKLHSYASWRHSIALADANYCRKRESIKLIDEDRRQRKGTRTDIAIAKQTAERTGSMREVVKEATNFQACRMAELWLKYCEPMREIDPKGIEVHYIWGKSGTNKTRYVYDHHAKEDVFRPTSYKWWEGYDGHKVVLLDELRGNWCTFGQLLDLLDIYPYRVETKGGSRQIQATTWYITSCFPPCELYNPDTFGNRERIDQLYRRLESITPTDPPVPWVDDR